MCCLQVFLECHHPVCHVLLVKLVPLRESCSRIGKRDEKKDNNGRRKCDKRSQAKK